MTAVSARAMLVGGVLAATGELTADITAEAALEAFRRSMGPESVWCATVPSVEGWELYERAVGGPPAEWVTPEESIVIAAAPALEAAWAQAMPAMLDRPSYLQPMLRFTTRVIADIDALARLGPIDGLPTACFIPSSLGDWRWHWPLRVGVVDSAIADVGVAAMRGNGEFSEHYDVGVVGRDTVGPFDILVTAVGDSLPLGVRAGAVVVIDSTPAPSKRLALNRHLLRGEQLSPGALIAAPGDDLSWFPALVRELSHDRPLDAAIGLVRPDAVTVAAPQFMAATSLRNWCRMAARRAEADGDTGLLDALTALVEGAQFDSEQGAAREATRAVRTAEDAPTSMGRYEVSGSSGMRAALPITGEVPVVDPRPVNEPSPPTVAPTTDPRPVSDDLPTAVDAEPPTTAAIDPSRLDSAASRRLFARVTDSGGRVRRDGFVRGVSRVELRIAATGSDDEVGATHTISSPNPGRAVVLDVTIHVSPQGSTARTAKTTALTTKLRFPARGDGPWTAPIEITVPSRAKAMTLFIVVQWKGRVIQSATLSGPVIGKRTAPGEPALSLDVDVSSDARAEEERPAADATFVLVPGRDDIPVVFDATSGIPIAPDALTRSNKMVRKTLIDAFMHPPTSLAEAAVPMADLARRGSLLRDSLRGKDRDFFDSATWIHVTSFGVAAVPFELIYTHPMPSPDTTVTVCGPALAGAISCAAGCNDRTNAERVCPFGFWGTTKIIERRQHSVGRDDPTPSEQRIVPVRTGGVAAVTPQADADDSTASTRIASAVAGFVSAGSGVSAATWTELEHAVSSPRHVICLVTHTIEPDDPDDDLAVELQLGAETRRLVSVDGRYVNPGGLQPGPVVLALGCDTGTIHASYAGFVSRLHSMGAEIVVSTIAQVPGRETADFVERMMTTFDQLLSLPGQHRFGAVLTEARRQTLCAGDVLALAVVATGDGDVRLGAG